MQKNFGKWMLTFCAVASFSIAANVQAQVLIEIDLSVENELTLNSTVEASAATVAGPTGIGFYMENFFAGDDGTSGDFGILVVGDLTTFLNPPDNTPELFRFGGDPGLNVFAFSTDATSNFEAGTQAFTGAANFTITPDAYAELLTAPAQGDIFFPADSVDDLGGAMLIGQYVVVFGDDTCDAEIGDINQDGAIDLLDVAPFVSALTGTPVCEADINEDNAVDLLDVAPFVALLSGG